MGMKLNGQTLAGGYLGGQRIAGAYLGGQLVWTSGAAPWTPLDLGTSLLAWYDPSDLSTLYQDTAGTVPVTATGQPVARMNDKSGNGNYLLIPNASYRPLYKTDGTLHWLEADGVDDKLITASSRFGLAANPTISVISGVRILSQASTQHKIFHIGDNGSLTLGGSFGSQGWAWRFDGAAVFFGPSATGVDRVTNFRRAAGTTVASSEFYLNGVSQSQTSTTNPTLSPTNTGASAVLFANNSSSTQANHRLYGMLYVGLNDRAVEAKAEAWMATKSGVAL